MKIRNIFLALLLMSVASVADCQQFSQKTLPPNLTSYDDAPYHFGFTLSLSSWGMTTNTIDRYYAFEHNNDPDPDAPEYVEYLNNDAIYQVLDVQSDFMSPGFAVGIVGNLRLGTYFDLRVIPGLSFTQQYIEYSLKESDMRTIMETGPVIRKVSDKVECVYLDLPVLIKYKGKRIHNVRPYIIGGFEGKINFLSGVGYASHTSDELSSLKLKPLDLYYTFGGGFDFYMFWFKLGVELRMAYSFFDTQDKLNGKHFCTNSLESLKSKEFQIVFTFE